MSFIKQYLGRSSTFGFRATGASSSRAIRAFNAVTQIRQILSEITGIPAEHLLCTQCFLNLMVPCLLILVLGRNHDSPVRQVMQLLPEQLADHLKTYAAAGPDTLASQWHKQ